MVMPLMNEHGLDDWVFKLDNSIARAGCCNFTTKTISLSKHLVRDAKHAMGDVRNTVLHEIAHALAGHGAAHGREWKVIALRIGCDGSRCHSMELKGHAWIMACVSCGFVNAVRHRVMCKFWNERACSRCGVAGAVKSISRDAWETRLSETAGHCT